MNLIQLRYFQAVCACGNLTQAAQQLHISQPSLSSAIQTLEKEFGVGLFVRQYRGVELTAEGEQLLKQKASSSSSCPVPLRKMPINLCGSCRTLVPAVISCVLVCPLF